MLFLCKQGRISRKRPTGRETLDGRGKIPFSEPTSLEKQPFTSPYSRSANKHHVTCPTNPERGIPWEKEREFEGFRPRETRANERAKLRGRMLIPTVVTNGETNSCEQGTSAGPSRKLPSNSERVNFEIGKFGKSKLNF
ncbi:Hypothetical protein NTJ_14036 [Nesidiocoris tenuis]|uniref:Uncharacterized protein n=1 Tax=Nesidiocoris tenuis TaxID=355587 RepID=A0ABN7BC23_9HEMI|nr:Hypothetical protein NTJ_14036 [Nesidiocoris tenuis]